MRGVADRGRARGLLLALAFVLAVLAPGAQARPVHFGINDTAVSHPEGAARILDLHQALGARLERIDVPWRLVQPERGRWEWSHVDRLLDPGAGRGMGTIALISSVPHWASTRQTVQQCLFNTTSQRCQRPPAPDRLGDFQEFLRVLVQRYPSLIAVEVFNEPNLGAYNWQPQADPEYYATVLRAARDAVHPVRPALSVRSGGLTPLSRSAPAGSLEPLEFLERMYRAGAHGAMDGIGLHPYPIRMSASDPGTSAYHRLIAEVRATRDRHGDAGRPLWVTETGYTTTGPFAVTPEQQAAWLPQLVDDALTEPDVAAVVVHTLRDRAADEDAAEIGYGLVYRDLTPKPVFKALADTVRLRLGRATAVEQPAAERPRRTTRRRARCRRSSRARRSCSCRRSVRLRRCRTSRRTRRD